MKIISNLLLTCLLVMSSHVSASSQDNNREEEIDSLLSEYSVRVHTKPFSTVDLVKELLEESEQLDDIRGQIKSQIILAKGYEHQKEYELSFEAIHKAEQLSNDNDYHKLDFMLYRGKGMILQQNSKHTEALPPLKRAISIAQIKKNKLAEASAMDLVGFCLSKMGEFDKSIAYLDSSLQIYKTEKFDIGLQKHHTYMGLYYSNLGKKDKAISEFEKGVSISKELKDSAHLIILYQNLMSNHAILGNVQQAKKYYNHRSELIDKIEYPEDRRLDLNIGVMYIQTEEYQKGIDVLNLCEEYYKKEGNQYRLALINHWKAIAYRGLNNYPRSAEKSKEAFKAAEEDKNIKFAELCSYTLFQTYHWRGNDTEAIDWLLKSQALKDSIFSEDNQLKMLSLETKYETFRKEQEIELLKAKSETERVKRNRLYLVLLLGSLLAAALLYAQRFRSKNRMMIQTAKLQKAELEKENLLQQLEFKQKELASHILNMTQKNQLLSDLKINIQDLKDEKNSNHISKLIRTINRSLENNDDWEQFMATFKSIHTSFLAKLQSLSSNLTSNEIRLASLMKMNLTAKEIASMLNITDVGVKKARYRLRKKLELDSDINMQDYLLSIE